MFRDLADKTFTLIIEKQKKIDFKLFTVLALFFEILKPKVTDTITAATITHKFWTELFHQAIATN